MMCRLKTTELHDVSQIIDATIENTPSIKVVR